MRKVAWPSRLMPRRSPPFLHGLAISVGAFVVAMALRTALMGADIGFGVAPTFFPALIVATLYAGPRWGAASLAAAIGLSLAAPSPMLVGHLLPVVLLFGLAGVLTVAMSWILREALLRLGEARESQSAASDALALSEARLRMAQLTTNVGFYDWDAASGEHHASPTLYRNFGLPPAEQLSLKALLKQIDPEDRRLVIECHRATMATGVGECEFRVVWPDGSKRWLFSRGETRRDSHGRLVHAAGINLDITERRMAYESLKASEREFRVLADSAPVLMWMTDAASHLEFINQASLEFTGRPQEQRLNPGFRLRLVTHPEDADRIVRENIEGRASRKEFTLEGRFWRGDGEWRWLRSVSRPRWGPDGEFLGYASVGYDVTDTKRAESDLRRINDLLSERVEAALAERDKAQAALHQAQKMEAVGELTGGVAHDFNNLLTVIIGALDLVERHPNDELRRTRMISAALGAARRGERLTHQLLAFARRQELKPQGACIDKLLIESEPLLRRAVGEAVSLVVAPGAPDAVAMIDTNQFEAAIMNLVVNARDAVSNGGAIRVESAPCDLAEDEVQGVPAGSYIRVVVHDTGVGMDLATAARAFEPFFTTKKVGKGTGLGLSQAYGFASQSGGGMALESELGKGSSIKLFLPRTTAAASPEEPTAAAMPNVEGALNILLVEDDVAVGDMVVAMLENLGHHVLRADGAEPALALLEQHSSLDLLITDLIMPGARTGVDLAREAVKLRPDLPVILSSGYTGEALNSAAATPWPLLRKPYSLDSLVRMIDQAVGPARSVA